MNSPRITLEQWATLVAVVEAGSYARAAERLHKTQSTVTYAVKKIESLLDVKAFDIVGRKAVLTSTGQTLYRRARVLIEEAMNAEASARSLSAGWEAQIRVVMEHVFPTRVMFEALDRFGRESPHTQIELIESILAGTAEALVQAQADIGITPLVPSGFFGEPLIDMRFVLVAHPDHPLHRLGRPVTQQDLRNARHLVVRESGSTRATRPALESTQRWTVSHMVTSIDAVRSGYGFAWLPEDMIRPELANGTLMPLPLREGHEPRAHLYLVYANRETAGPGTLRLGEIILATTREACAKQEGTRSRAGRSAQRASRSK
jgi:DNA-binding transcriptional LysR family regulator